MTLDQPRSAFEALQAMRKEALDAGATASAASVSRTLVLAAKLAGDSAAELKFATEWHQQAASKSSGRVLAAVTRALGGGSADDEPTVEREDLHERLVLLVEKFLTGNLQPSGALSELTNIRSEALASGAAQLAGRCLDEMVVVAIEHGETPRALEMARELVTEMPCARAFNMLGRAAAAAGEHQQARRAFELAVSSAVKEGDVDEEAQAREGISGIEPFPAP